MKILLVAPQPFYEERGTPIAVRLLAESLSAMGHQTDLLVYGMGQDISIEGLNLIRSSVPFITSVPIGISLKKIICDIGLVFAMMKLLRRKKYDVVHAVEEAVFPAAFLQGFYHYPLVYDMDSSMADQLTDKWWPFKPLRQFLEIFEKLAVRRSSAVLAVCEDLAIKVRRWTLAEQVIVLPDVPMNEVPIADSSTATVMRLNPNSMEDLRALTGPDSVIALYVGNLERYQGIDLLFDSMAQLPPDSKVHAVLIGGNAAHVAQYQQRAVQLGIQARVHLLGARSLKLLGSFLSQADVLLSPRTLGTNTPMKIYSYMQAGKAIMATDIRSHTQALDSSCAELAVPNAIAFAAGLTRLAADPQRRARLGDAARDKAEREYSLPVYRRKLRDLYDRLARSPGSAPAAVG